MTVVFGKLPSRALEAGDNRKLLMMLHIYKTEKQGSVSGYHNFLFLINLAKELHLESLNEVKT